MSMATDTVAAPKIISELLQGPGGAGALPKEWAGANMPSSEEQAGLAQKFDALMQADEAGTMQMVTSDATASQPSVISNLVQRQDNLLQDAINSVNDLKTDVRKGDMSMVDMALRGEEVATKVANAAFNLQAEMGIANGSKRSVETMVKVQ